MAKNENFKTKLLLTTGFLISGYFGYLAFHDFQWIALCNVVLNINHVFFTFAGLTMILSFTLRAFRWKSFLPKNEKFTFSSRLSGIAIGYFFSNILPGRLGDVLRPAYLSKTNHQSFKVCLYSIVLERTWELVIFILMASFFLKHSSVSLIEKLNINYSLLVMIFISGLFFLVYSEKVLSIIYRITLKYKINIISNSIKELINAFKGNNQKGRVAFIILLTAAIFMTEGIFFAILIESIGISITFSDKIIVMVISALSIMLPSGPAAVGVFHYFCQFSLTLFGVDKEIATSAAILIHAYMFIFDFIFALFCIIGGPLKSGYLLKKEFLAG